MTGAGLLNQLAPAHAPPPPGWWPPAIGWWFIAILAVVVVIAAAAWHRNPRRRLRRAALRELQALDHGVTADDATVARGIELLMRRYALQRFGAEATARLTGEAWLTFIVDHGGRGFSGDIGRDLLRSAYGGGGPAQRAAWLASARDFLQSRT